MKAFYAINQLVKLTTLSWLKLLLLLFLFIISSPLVQAQTKIWDRTYGGIYTSYFDEDIKFPIFFEYGNSFLQAMVATPDGGYLLGGYSDSEEGNDKSEGHSAGLEEYSYDFWIIKIDADGNKQWDRTLFSDYQYSSQLTAITPTTDGGFLLGGKSSPIDPPYNHRVNYDYFVIKIDANGNEIWRSFFGGDKNDLLTSIIATADNSYLLGGSSSSDISGSKSQASKGDQDYWLVKIDGDGNKIWDKVYGGSNNDGLSVMLSTSEGGFLLGGTSDSGIGGDKSHNSKGAADYWVVSIDGNGNKLWDKTYGGDNYESLSAAVATPEGGYLLGGYSSSDISGDKSQTSKGEYDYWILKVDASGNKLWDKGFGGNRNDLLSDLVATTDNGYLLAGSSKSTMDGDKSEITRDDPDTNYDYYGGDYWIIKINEGGSKVYDRTFGGNDTEEFTSLLATADGHYLLGGSSYSGRSGDKSENNKGYESDYWVLKLKQESGTKEQAITFDPIPDKEFGIAPFTLLATASSGLPVSYSIVSGPATITGNIITLTGLGTVIIKASQVGNATYVAAADVSRTFFVEGPSPLTKQWDKTFGGNSYDFLSVSIATPDGGYLWGGTSQSGNSGDKSEALRGGSDMWIVKTDASGNKVWDRIYGGSGDESLQTIVITSDGHFLLGGSSSSDINGDKSQASRGSSDYWLVKIDDNGNKLWDKTFGGTSSDYLSAIVATPEGGYLLGGTSHSGKGGDKSQNNYNLGNLSNDYWVVKINATGNKVWDKSFGTINDDNLSALLVTPDRGYLLGGSSSSNQNGSKSQNSRGQSDFWIIKINSSGAKVWDKTFGGGLNDYLSALVATTDNSFLLGGTSYSDKGGDKTENRREEIYGADYWLIKVDANGSKIWDKTFGGNNDDHLNKLIATLDGGYLLGGSSSSSVSGDKTGLNRGWNDYWLVKITNKGVKEWDKTFGGESSDLLSDLVASSDNSYLLGGYSWSSISNDKSEASRGEVDYWVIKVKEEGTPPPVSTWNKTFGGKSFERLTSVVKTSDGGYLLGGHSLSRIGGDRTQDTQGRYDYWIVKTDATGSKLWEQSYGGSNDDYLNQIIPTADGGYLLAGSSQSGISGDKSQGSRGNQDFWILKISSSGAKQWDRSYGGSGFEDLMQAVQLSTGEYVLAGVSASDMGGEKSQNRRGSRDFWLIKVSATGQKLWDQRYGGSKAEELGSLVVTADGGFVLGGSSLSGESGDKTSTGKGGKDYWLVKTNSQGNLQWDKSYGGNGEDQLTALTTTTGGALLLAGHSSSGISGDKSSVSRGSSDYWLIKTNAQGIKQWDKTYGGNSEDELASLISTQDGGWLLGGSSFSNLSGEKSQNSKGISDYWAVKLDAQGEKLWDQTHGGAGEERLHYLLQTEDQGYLLAGFSFSDQGGEKSQARQGRSDYWLVKIPPMPATQIRMAAQPIAELTSNVAARNFRAFPVPARDKVTVQFTLSQTQPAVVQLYNAQGAKVKTLFQGEAQANKTYQVEWQPASQDSNGLYFLQLQAKRQKQSLKILLSR